MDTLYTGDIPSDYCYAVFGENYIDLYKDAQLQGHEDFYRLYLYENTFIYEHKFTEYNETVIPTYVATTDDYMYRRDFASIVLTSFIYILLIIFLINIISSVFKKGGLLGGLL